MSKKAPKHQRSHSILGSYFGAFWVPNLIFVHFVCDNFYVYFWHRFWEASTSIFDDFGGHFRVPFELILNTFPKMLQNSKNATLSGEMLVLGRVGLPVLHNVC